MGPFWFGGAWVPDMGIGFGVFANYRVIFRICIRNCNDWRIESEWEKRSQFVFGGDLGKLYAENLIWRAFTGFGRWRRTAGKKVRSQPYKKQTYNQNKTKFLLFISFFAMLNNSNGPNTHIQAPMVAYQVT